MSLTGFFYMQLNRGASSTAAPGRTFPCTLKHLEVTARVCSVHAVYAVAFLPFETAVNVDPSLFDLCSDAIRIRASGRAEVSSLV